LIIFSKTFKLTENGARKKKEKLKRDKEVVSVLYTLTLASSNPLNPVKKS